MPVYCITGANRGIGLEFVRQLAQSPENTVIATVRPGADTAELEAVGSPQTHILECDTSSVPAIHLFSNKLGRLLDGQQKKIDFLINNAGFHNGSASESSLSLDHTNFAQQISVNVVGPAKVVEFLLDHKLLSPSVRIANMSSGLASLAQTAQKTEPLKHTGYSISKTALNMLTVHQSRDIRSKASYGLPHAVVVVLDPGWVKTRMGGEGAVLEPAEAISNMLKTLQSLQDEDNGGFVRHNATVTLALIIYLLPPLPSRSFAVSTANGSVVYPEFAYPLRQEILPAWLYIITGPVLPVTMLLVLQLWIRSLHDANNAIFGVLYSLSSGVLFQVIIKWLIGGLRPHFLDVCKPDLSLAGKTSGAPYNGAGFQDMYYTREICTGIPSKINDSLTSFPSGHATGAFGGFIFVYLYINAKFKVFADRHTSMWKLLLIHSPILLGVLLGGALTIDEFHNWYDIVAGGIIGTLSAISSYRMCYASLFDYRWNHIPLSRSEPFSYDLQPPQESVKEKTGRGKKE